MLSIGVTALGGRPVSSREGKAGTRKRQGLVLSQCRGLDDPRVVEHRIRAVSDARKYLGRDLKPEEFADVLDRVEAAQARKEARPC